MDMNRRNVLIGLGAVAAGGGAVLGSGAFSQVSAERTISASTTGDGSAYLELNGDGTYVTTSSNQIEFAFDSLNENADSTFDNILTITLNAGDPSTSDAVASSYDVYFGNVTGLGSGSALNFEEQSSGTTIVGSGNAVTLQYGNQTADAWDTVDIRAIFNLKNNAVGDIPTSVTIVADDGV